MKELQWDSRLCLSTLSSFLFFLPLRWTDQTPETILNLHQIEPVILIVHLGKMKLNCDRRVLFSQFC